MATVMYLQGMKQMAEKEREREEGVVKDCARPLCGRLGKGSCNEPFRDRSVGEIGSLIAYLRIDSSVEILNETVNIC